MTAQLLAGDRAIEPLLAKNPFPDRPPAFVRAVLYHYEMVRPFSDDGRYWKRTPVGTYFRPLALGDPELTAFLSRFGFRDARGQSN
jgi:hypothetical protein